MKDQIIATFLNELKCEIIPFFGFDENDLKIEMFNYPLYYPITDTRATAFNGNNVKFDLPNGILSLNRTVVEKAIESRQPMIIRHVLVKSACLRWHYLKNLPISPADLIVEIGACATAINQLIGINNTVLSDATKPAIKFVMKQFTGKDFRVIDGVSNTNIPITLALPSERDKRDLLAEYDRCLNQPLIKDNIKAGDPGSKRNPFKNVDEAADYIFKMEQSAIDNSEFLHSRFNRYPYILMPLQSFPGKVRELCYALPWASANTAFVNNMPDNQFIVTQLTKTNENLLKVYETGDIRFKNNPLFAIKPNLRNRKFLFRGQNADFGSCRPSLFRKDKNGNIPKYFLTDIIKNQELACLISQHPLVKLLAFQGVTLFNEPFSLQYNTYGLAQHYYGKTSLMDLTSDMDVAKFFAVAKYDFNTDSFQVYKNGELGVLYYYELKMPNAFTRPMMGCYLSTIGKQYYFARSEMQSGFLLDMPRGRDFESLPNVHKVYFRHDTEVSTRILKSADYGQKYYPDEPLRRIWWEKQKRHADGEPFEISPMAIEVNQYFNNEESCESIIRKLHELGNFKISSKHVPIFPQEIIDDYYANAKQLWSKYCKNVHFIGSEGVIMKEALCDLPYNPLYSWAF